MKAFIRMLVIVCGGIAVFLAQTKAVAWHWRFSQELNLLNYGTGLLFVMLFEALWGVLSGAVIGLMISANPSDSSNRVHILLYIVAFAAIPAVALIVRWGTAAGNWFHFLRYDEFWEWAVNSPVPAFWIGIGLGWGIRQLLPKWWVTL